MEVRRLDDLAGTLALTDVAFDCLVEAQGRRADSATRPSADLQ